MPKPTAAATKKSGLDLRSRLTKSASLYTSSDHSFESIAGAPITQPPSYDEATSPHNSTRLLPIAQPAAQPAALPATQQQPICSPISVFAASLAPLPSNPTVSICTPTCNRRPFLLYLAECIHRQIYPAHLIEWIVVDDGPDSVEDLFVGDTSANIITQTGLECAVHYTRLPNQLRLGAKRNRMHELCTGNILVYMDDDDYYPPERVSHAVHMLQTNPTYLIAGSSEMHIHFESRGGEIYQFGPFSHPNHATAATFAFRRELLQITQYDENESIAEEVAFLKKHTIPMLQLNTRKTILVIAHMYNSINKEKMIFDENPYVKKSEYSASDFIVMPTPSTQDPTAILGDPIYIFYTRQVQAVLAEYKVGDPLKCKRSLVQVAREREARVLGRVTAASQAGKNKHMKDRITECVQMLGLNGGDAEDLVACFDEICKYYEDRLKEKDAMIDKQTRLIAKMSSSSCK